MVVVQLAVFHANVAFVLDRYCVSDLISYCNIFCWTCLLRDAQFGLGGHCGYCSFCFDLLRVVASYCFSFGLYDVHDFSCVNVFGNARLVIESRGICRHVDVRTDGAIEMKNDGFAMDVTFSSGGRFNGIMFVNETHFDTLTDIVIDGGFVGKNPDNPNQTLQGATVFAGQTANHTTIDATATLTVNSGGKVSRTIGSGNLNVTWYGTAYDTVVQSNGYVKVMETGNIDGITVLSGGVLRSEQHESGSVDNLHIMSGGALESSYLRYGKSFVFDEGAILRGNIWNMANLTFAGTVDNSAAFITLDFSRRNASDGIMLGNIASLNNANMDLIVDSRQPHDSYAIASGAADFSGTITLRNTDGIMYGQLSLSRSRFVYNTEEYTLTLNESNELYLNISRYIPEADVILLYKRGQFVGSVESAYEVTVPVDEYEHMFVTSGGLVEGTEILSSGALTILEGGSALETHVGNNGEMNVLKGGTATDIYLDQKARLNIVEGSVDDITEINTWQANNINIFVTSGGTACNVSSARISLAAGGKLLSGTIDSANVSSGGLMEDVSVKGRITVYDGGVVSNASFAGDPATVSSGGLLSVGLISGATVYLSGGTGVELTMTSGALQVFSGGTASDAVLNVTYNSSAYAGRWYFGFFGHAFVSEGGVALHTRITGGTQLVLSGGVASRTELVSMGSEIVSDGAESIDAELTRGGKLFIRGGGVARNVYAQRNGAIIVSRFGVAESAVLESNNIMLVSSEGIVSDTLVKSGGKLYLREGAVMNGHLQAEDGAVIMVYDGATIDFDLSKGNSNTPFIDNFQ